MGQNGRGRNNSDHRVVLTFEAGYGARAKLICPEFGCVPGEACAHCGRAYGDADVKRCYDCPEAGAPTDECWIKSWFDNLTTDELMDGTIEVAVDVEWTGDGIVAHIAELPLSGESASPRGGA